LRLRGIAGFPASERRDLASERRFSGTTSIAPGFAAGRFERKAGCRFPLDVAVLSPENRSAKRPVCPYPVGKFQEGAYGIFMERGTKDEGIPCVPVPVCSFLQLDLQDPDRQ
jgi:hypothetical protein